MYMNGATVTSRGAHFRVWAPSCRSIDVIIRSNSKTVPLKAQKGGFFEGDVPGARAGDLYWFRLNGTDNLPDPCSRYQPEGPHGPSQIIDPKKFKWTDRKWKGTALQHQVIYELHIGTFTKEGTFKAAQRELKELKKFGITIIEVMPLAECAGRWNWGYDGVDFYAPYHVYGDPDDVRRFVNEAHKLGMAVILDVVYNHAGPDGNYLGRYSQYYFSKKHKTDWGDAINYDAAGSKNVRDFFIENACYWIREFHFDGLRLDATQNIIDDSPRHFLLELSERTRRAAGNRKIVIVAENDQLNMRLLEPIKKGGYGLDGIWNDDFSHSCRTAMTGFREGYYSDFAGDPQEFVSLINRFTLFQGQYSPFFKKFRGTPVRSEPASAFISYFQNHDQIATSVTGERIDRLTSPGQLRAMTMFWLLSPFTPMFFMGQEFQSSSPFLFFVDCNDELKPYVKEGRKEFLSMFPSYALPGTGPQIEKCCSSESFFDSKLDFSERKTHADMYEYHRKLLALRKSDPIISGKNREKMDGAVLGQKVFCVKHFGYDRQDRLLIVNYGPATNIPLAEPLLAPPATKHWKFLMNSGGPGALNWQTGEMPAECALLYTV